VKSHLQGRVQCSGVASDDIDRRNAGHGPGPHPRVGQKPGCTPTHPHGGPGPTGTERVQRPGRRANSTNNGPFRARSCISIGFDSDATPLLDCATPRFWSIPCRQGDHDAQFPSSPLGPAGSLLEIHGRIAAEYRRSRDRCRSESSSRSRISRMTAAIATFHKRAAFTGALVTYWRFAQPDAVDCAYSLIVSSSRTTPRPSPGVSRSRPSSSSTGFPMLSRRGFGKRLNS
jgi:hypothetical protein